MEVAIFVAVAMILFLAVWGTVRSVGYYTQLQNTMRQQRELHIRELELENRRTDLYLQRLEGEEIFKI